MLDTTSILVLSVGLLALTGGCSSDQVVEKNTGEAAAASGLTSIEPPAPGTSRRVGGDLAATITGTDGDYRVGPCRIDTPLPKGYPAPTPPGAIDIKTYPGVRRAVVKGESGRSPDAGMNSTFWPLFNHIKKHDIAMTSPVEMDYQGLSRGGDGKPQDWSMAFLYRTPEMNATGEEGRVSVVDAPPVTVVAVGMKGDYSMSLVNRGMEQIENWLANNPQWQVDSRAGSWRSLYYNGPSLGWWNKWAEVQIPVKASTPAQ